MEESNSAPRVPLVVVVDSVRSLYNVGSIFRTADAARIERLVLTGFSPHPPRKEIEKTALGATKTVPWEYVRDPAEAIQACRAQGYRTLGLELTDSGVPYSSIRREEFPLCLVVGNEVTGISARVLQECDGAVEIPMFGMKQSLNVAVAFGISVYELGRIWREGSGKAPAGRR